MKYLRKNHVASSVDQIFFPGKQDCKVSHSQFFEYLICSRKGGGGGAVPNWKVLNLIFLERSTMCMKH